MVVVVVVVTFKFKLTEEVCMVSRFGSPINKSSSMTSKLVFKLDSSTFPYGIKWKVKVSDIQSQNWMKRFSKRISQQLLAPGTLILSSSGY